MGCVTVRMDDADVAAVALYAPLPWALRLDVLPFTWLYATAVYLFLTRDEGDVVAALLVAIVGFVQALTFLLGEWSVDAGVWLGFAPLRKLRVADPRTEVFVKVVPASTLLSKQLCRCLIIRARVDETEEKNEVPLLCFSYQNLTFCLYDDVKAVHAGLASFRRLDFPTQLPLQAYAATNGYIALEDVARARLKWGKNDFDIPVPGFAVLLKEQLVAPFFVFQFFCMLLWCLDEYVYYSLMTLCMLVVFECTVVKQRQRNMEILNGMRRAPQPLFVYRAGRWSEVMSDELVPGDVCSIGHKTLIVARPNEEKLTNIPCDMLLLRGNCVVTESMLTGESVPLRKEDITSDCKSEVLAIDDGTSQVHKRHVLFGGTKIIQHTVLNHKSSPDPLKIPNAPDKGCLVYVLRTGFGTTQGSLMRTILHSSQRATANTSEAMWFILLLLGFAIAASSFVLHHGLNDSTRSRYKLILHCIMIITSVVPPELPMQLSLAVTNSLLALMKFNIYCTEPFRIPFAGRIDVCCFDKTGTLTSDEMRMRGVAGLETTIADGIIQHEGHFDLISPDHLPLDTELVLAGCQSLVFVNGQVMGNPLEAAALKSIKWTQAGYPSRSADAVEPTFFSSSRGVVQAVHVLHRFSFSSDLKRMTTIVSIEKCDNDEEDEVRVVTKGAPEVLEPLFAEKPAHYTRVYRHFASKGCRVLALGYRRLGHLPITSVNELARRSHRSDIERDLSFAGFLVLDCPLKEDTKRTICDLQASKHKIIVITGDNALTACDAARQIGVITKPSINTLMLQKTKGGYVEWQGIDDGSNQGNLIRSILFTPEATQGLSADHDLAVTGEALTAISLRVETQHPNDDALAFDLYLRTLTLVCPFVSVFARTSPQQKEHIILALNRAGKTTAMCGDGTNDVGALKRAHVGVSIVNNPDAENSQRSLAAQIGVGKPNGLYQQLRRIQEEEEQAIPVHLGDASIASPFTSKSSSIRVVKQLVRQGRCTLVTTIQMYKILGVNCLITAYYLSSLYLHGVKNGDRQLTIVGLSIAMFFFFLSRARPAKRLSAERPPSGVFCGPVFMSIFGQSFIHLVFLYAALAVAQPYIDYADPAMHPDGKFTPNVVNTIMFLLSAVMQLNTFVTNYKGKPFMESFWQNKLLCRSAIASYVVLTLAAFELFPSLNDTLELVPMPNDEVQLAVFGLMVGNTFAVLALERSIDCMCSGWY